MALRAKSAETLALRGPSSGRVYLFSRESATVVSARDAEILLRTGVLEPAGA